MGFRKPSAGAAYMMNLVRLEVAEVMVAGGQGLGGRRKSAVVSQIWRSESHGGYDEGVVNHYLLPAH